jgi:vancomycin resistance protein YoaR
MEANLRSTERYNHSMLPGYSLPGLDATVVWGVLDYKFKNNYDFPVYVEAYTSNRNLVFNIYGSKEGMAGKTYKLIAETTETLQPTVTTKEDATLDEGTTQWEKNPVVGYKAKSYLITYENGKEINRENVSSDKYTKVDGVVKKGTKKVVQNKVPSTQTTSEQNSNT